MFNGNHPLGIHGIEWLQLEFSSVIELVLAPLLSILSILLIHFTHDACIVGHLGLVQ
jgi:hypothetical protein